VQEGSGEWIGSTVVGVCWSVLDWSDSEGSIPPLRLGIIMANPSHLGWLYLSPSAQARERASFCSNGLCSFSLNFVRQFMLTIF
jgi:hypothetical protein